MTHDGPATNRLICHRADLVSLPPTGTSSPVRHKNHLAARQRLIDARTSAQDAEGIRCPARRR